jgi:ferredoxin
MLRALAAQLMGPAAAQHAAAALHSSPLLHRLLPAALHAASDAAAAPAGRSLHSSAAQQAASSPSPSAPDSTTDTITVTFVDKDGNDVVVQAPLGKSLLEVAHDNEIELEGACEGSLACSTCHVIVEDEDLFKRMPEATEDELDMLDLAFGLTETSRLGCQVLASKELDGLRVRLPAATRNFYVDGHTPKPH